MKIKCSHTELLNIDDARLIPNPRNPNDHSKNQIIQFSKILKYQGQRKAIVISKRSGFIVTGHGTLMAAKESGADKIAVDFQDFDSDAQEYAHVVSDNAIATQAVMNLSMITDELPNLGDDFELDLLGIDDLNLDSIDETKEEVKGERSLDLRFEMDYLVFVFKDKEKFNIALDKYKVEKVSVNSSSTYHESFEIGGIGRIVDGNKLL